MGSSDHGTTRRRVGGDDEELRPWHFISLYIIGDLVEGVRFRVEKSTRKLLVALFLGMPVRMRIDAALSQEQAPTLAILLAPVALVLSTFQPEHHTVQV